jgi:hypothetical protein
MHPTADTLLLKLRQRRGAAGDAGRYAAFDYNSLNGMKYSATFSLEFSESQR